MIGCIEEVALIHKFIDKSKFNKSIEKYGKSKYSQYLKNL